MTAADGSARSGARPPRPAGAGGAHWAASDAVRHLHGCRRRSRPEGYRPARGAADYRAGRTHRLVGPLARRSRRHRRSGRPGAAPRGVVPGWTAGAGAGCRCWNAARSRLRRGRHRRRPAARPMTPDAPGRSDCLSHCVPVYSLPRLMRRSAAARELDRQGLLANVCRDVSNPDLWSGTASSPNAGCCASIRKSKHPNAGDSQAL